MNFKIFLILVNLAAIFQLIYGGMVQPLDNTETCSPETQTTCDEHAADSKFHMYDADLDPYCYDDDYMNCDHLDGAIVFSLDEPVDALIAYFSMCVSQGYKNVDKYPFEFQGPFEIGQNYTRIFTVPLTISGDYEKSNTSSTIMKMTFEDKKSEVGRQIEEKIVDKCYVVGMIINQNDPGAPDGPFIPAFNKLF